MKESYIPKYYTFDKIPDHRNQYIDIQINWLIETFRLKSNNWPLDCVSLINIMKHTQIVPFTYSCYTLPNKCDAVAEFIPEYDVYILQINTGKVKYPYEHSRDRRLNFTIAHEIGHIFLGHLLTPRNFKSEEELLLEELESNEFAGRLLMPSEIIHNCNYYSLDTAAKYFIVSKSALWQRLNNMKRLDLLHSKIVPACSKCGNTYFSPYAEFCSICGQSIRDGIKGVRRHYYPQIMSMDRYRRVEYCPKCNKAVDSISKDRCSICGTYLFNFCSGYSHGNMDNCSYTNLGNSRYCEMCGKPTHYYTQGFLKPWDYGVCRVAEECTLYGII